MKLLTVGALLGAMLLSLISHSALAADYAAKEGDWIARDFRFHTGQVTPELRVHYTTLGNPAGEPVLLLHGTGGAGPNFLDDRFAGEMFGPGQPLDASKHFIILPDAIGHGKSAKPSDGLRMTFPDYNYADMVQAQHRLLTEGLGIRHVRLVMGNSMGGMEAWVWGVTHPDFMDALVPMASTPAAMSGRNWVLRRMLMEAIRRDPAWKGGDYTAQPATVQLANVFFGFASNGGAIAMQESLPTSAAGDALVESSLAAPFTSDANDVLYQFAAARDYDPSEGLERIVAPVLAINSADDERNPVETGVMERQLKRLPKARLFLIPASAQTLGHGTTRIARLYAHEVAAFLARAPHRP